eukprot:TRINITY_DN3588_c0_g1_i1.p1 TRINITY_DN3588_c0_g1~~TRINITY_DN3588_c0_g1_i1.p1  ORF type:complete len:426 (-),score=69.30 TRINITY_DN3588_c0_g1_i1:259-1536(-)
MTLWLVLLFATHVACWDTHEHTLLGDLAQIKLPNASVVPASGLSLAFPNNNSLRFGQILASMGDLYALPDSPISDASGAAAQQQVLLAALDTLITAPDKPDGDDPGNKTSSALGYQSLRLLAGPEASIEAALARAAAAGKEPSSAYSDVGSPDFTARWNVMTGGGSAVSDYVPFGRYVELAEVNWDHFSYEGRAWATYTAGHSVAMQAAASAHALTLKNATETEVLAALQLAYIREASAQHFLTDMFAAGHVRTPRKIFANQCSPSETGSYISRYQHDEECHYGLNVTNLKGDLWIAYGDMRLLDVENAENMARAQAAVQASLDEVYSVFSSGVVLANSSEFATYSLVPSVVETNSLSPMFKWDGQMLWRRDNLNDLRGTKYIKQAYIDGWSSATTLVELELLYGPPSNLPPRKGAVYGHLMSPT